MKAELSIKLISYFAPNCPRRIVAPNCPRRIVQRRIVLRRIVREPLHQRLLFVLWLSLRTVRYWNSLCPETHFKINWHFPWATWADAEIHFKQDNAKVVALAQSVNIEMKEPRQCERQVHRSNPGSSKWQQWRQFQANDIWAVGYLDSLISPLMNHFSEDNGPQCQLFRLQPIYNHDASWSCRVQEQRGYHQSFVYNMDSLTSSLRQWIGMIFGARNNNHKKSRITCSSSTCCHWLFRHQHVLSSVRLVGLPWDE